MLNKKFRNLENLLMILEKIKKNFFSENDKYLKNLNKIGNIYKKQTKRENCKACNRNNLIGKKFVNHGITYIQCKSCSHINGMFNDTNKFNKKVYTDKKLHYANRYNENLKLFLNRREKIYTPKAKFLKKNFKSISKIKVIDIASGSGYFLSALKKVGFKDVKGYEFSKSMVEYGKKFLVNEKIDNYLEHKNFEEIKKQK